ncbi:uncharacterized protein [Antedon mediterranea]|uniref:uncharacterized protein n=1 Tax=Antedon mediterranea TaxID=105859 RepID=UPI003AF8E50F
MDDIEIKKLSPQAVIKIGSKLETTGDWTVLAYHCNGTSHFDSKAIKYKAEREKASPTSIVLTEWMQNQGSVTVRDLIVHLQSMNRYDIIQEIKELWDGGLLGHASKQSHRPSMEPPAQPMDWQALPGPGSSSWLSVQPMNFNRSPKILDGSTDRTSESSYMNTPHYRPNLYTESSLSFTSNVCSVDLTKNQHMSSLTGGESANPCAAPSWSRTSSQDASRPTNPHSESSPRRNDPQTQSTFLDKVTDNSCGSNQFLTWPKMNDRLSSNTIRTWPSSNQNALRSPPTHEVPAQSNSIEHNVYHYRGEGLRSVEPVYQGTVFITYSADCSKYIPRIHKALKEEGYCVLTDVKSSVVQQDKTHTTKEDFQNMLKKGIENCDYILCLLCEDYMRELKGHDQSKALMNIQFINCLLDSEFKENGKQNKRFIPICLSESMSVSSLPPYLVNFPSELQDKFVTVINKALGREKSDLVIYKVEHKKKSKISRLFKKS